MSTDAIKCTIDCVSISGTVAVLIGYLPAVTAVLTFIWTVIRLYETETVQRFIQRFRNGSK